MILRTYIDCWVNDGNGKKGDTLIDARRYGIASVLTQLCLMYPKLNGKEKIRSNEAYNQLEVDETCVAKIKKV